MDFAKNGGKERRTVQADVLCSHTCCQTRSSPVWISLAPIVDAARRCEARNDDEQTLEAVSLSIAEDPIVLLRAGVRSACRPVGTRLAQAVWVSMLQLPVLMWLRDNR